jgi:two-component system, OmpR family, response regulator
LQPATPLARFMTFNPNGPYSPWTARRVVVYDAPLRVLVVDDNQNAAEALAAYLAFERMQCRVAFGGVEAVSIGTTWIPHAIVMDISMPDCTGVEAATALRQDPRTCAVAIIAFTALDETEVRRLAGEGHFDGYCQKGQSPANLVALITTLTD